MSTTEIFHEIRIKASPGAVYQALTDAKTLGQWWIPDTRGESAVGKNLEFWFGGEECQIMRVVELKADERVEWRPQAGDVSDWAGTRIEFTLFPNDGRTYVHFRHSGFREGFEGFPHYSLSWAVYLVSLKDFLEKGKGHPFPNESTL